LKQLLLEQPARPFDYALGVLLVLNVLDAVFTSWWIATGLATEANPLMAKLLDHGIAPFVLTKVGIGIAAVLVFKAFAKHRLSHVGVVGLVAIHLGVFMMHMSTGAEQLTQMTILASR
jgi:Domain of unknown function (DUF5658)